jgi:hypothetical protein
MQSVMQAMAYREQAEIHYLTYLLYMISVNMNFVVIVENQEKSVQHRATGKKVLLKITWLRYIEKAAY